jgi:protein-S-isoprenylcysteine O-methyltransferase Ste14
MIVIAPIVFVTLFVMSEPYGRYHRAGWGPSVGNRTGWLMMEAPASLLMLVPILFLPLNGTVFLLLVLWQVHYFHRAFIYPFTLTGSRKMPVTVVGMAIVFNTANAYLNGYHFVLHENWYNRDWLLTPNFLGGLVLFATGFYITKKSDRILRNLREPGETAYRIPQGFMYRWVSCPNYLGECIQWLGWALMTMSPAGWVFLLWTLANLVPRAISHHKWYRENFEDYPVSRKAIIPAVF